MLSPNHVQPQKQREDSMPLETTMNAAEERSDRTIVVSTPQRRRQLKYRRHGGRLWQLPESTIQEYAKVIQEKPLSEQSSTERRFLWKYQRRLHLLQHKLPSENMKDYVERLEQKEERTQLEDQLIKQFHRRRARRRSQMGSVPPPPIFWRRNRKSPPNASVSILSSNMASLRESMDKLGLSSEKLRNIKLGNAK